jgi:hypothetical protein
VLLAVCAANVSAQYSIKEATTAPPGALDKGISSILREGSVQFLDESGAVQAELWFVKELAAKATPEQVKNGLTYREVPETSVLGVIEFKKQGSDYRKQKIKPGVYTLRLAYQPQDGDHMGTAPYPEFALLLAAQDDKKPALIEEVKEMHDLSTKATGTSHPGVFLLFQAKDPGATPRLQKADNPAVHWLLTYRQPVNANGQKTFLVFALTLIGVSPAA